MRACVCVCVSPAQRNGLENSACSCKKCNRQLERERVKKQGSFCLQQPRFYPLVAECCLALQISAQAWTDTGGLSWPCSSCPGPPPHPPVSSTMQINQNERAAERVSGKEKTAVERGIARRQVEETGKVRGEVGKEGNGGLERRGILCVCVFMVDRKKEVGGRGGEE